MLGFYCITIFSKTFKRVHFFVGEVAMLMAKTKFKIRKWIPLAALVVSGVGVASCNYRTVKDAEAYAARMQKSTGSLTGQSLISWPVVQSSVLSSCRSCHTGKNNPDLSTLSLVRQKLSVVQSEIVSGSMPPEKNGYAPLDACQKAVLNAWIASGAPENGTQKVSSLSECQNIGDGQSGAKPPLAETALTYDNVIQRILQPKCITCHNPDADNLEAAGLLFYPYEEIQKRPRLWRAPGASSKLIHSVTRSDEDRMPPPPDESLTKEEIDFLSRWIDAGAPK